MVNWAVEIAKLAVAEAEIQRALSDYRQTVARVKSAGDALAANWEGEAQKVFVVEHQNAYKWHNSIIEIVMGYVNTLKSTAEKYTNADTMVKSLIGKK